MKVQGSQEQLVAMQEERDAALAQLAEAQQEAAALRASRVSTTKGINGSPQVCVLVTEQQF